MRVELPGVDQLTGLFTKDRFFKEARRCIDDNSDIVFGIISLDINRLTMINEIYGLEEGDKLLKYMGDTIQRILLGVTNSACGRLQADHFVLMCPFDKEHMERYVDEIERDIKRYSLSLNLDILISFGIYRCEEPTLNVSIMCDRAAMAMKTVKGNYIHHVAYYDENMHDQIVREQEITQTMNRALNDREFVVYYQPKHSLDDERIIGAEALVRWLSPTKGIISPGVFIPIFEETGFIMKLDAYVWEEACRFIKAKLIEGIPIQPVSVNISRVNLYNPELCNILNNLVEKYAIPYEMLELEFTESAYTDNPQLMIQTMLNLQNMGFKVEMDDFGSGYSSLNMLKDVPVDVLKIDLHFLSSTDHSEKASSIMSAVVRMAKTLGITSIVEGVETEEQICFLKSIGCTMVQGYYFAKPMPEEEYTAYILKYADISEEISNKISKEFIAVDLDEFWKELSENKNSIIDTFDCYAIYEVYNDREELIRVSDSYYELFGTSREKDYIKNSYARINVREDEHEIVGKMYADAADGVHVGHGVFHRRMPDGSYKLLSVKAKLLNYKDNSRIYFVGINDLSEFLQ